MHLIPLLTIILYILCDELLETAAVASTGISDIASSVAFHLIRSAAIGTTTTTVTRTITDTNASTTFPIIRNDLLCNNGSEFVCVCQQNAGDLLKHYSLCSELIETEELPVIEMSIKRVNLSGRLHTNETYESYFKRRVAAVVSNYCEQQADECMATTLRLKKENVVLLSIKPNSLQSTTIGFVITKSQRRRSLSTMTILDSTKVKYVLSAQMTALSRILGGVRIEKVETAMMGKYRDNNGGETTKRDNSGLLLILSVAATFLIITYTIATIRVCRDCFAKKKAQKNAGKSNNAAKTPNYGTCIESKQSDLNRKNEVPSTVKLMLSEGNDTDSSSPGEIAIMDAYQMKRMFQCDPSQLPAEGVMPFPQTSNDSFVMFAPKCFRESQSKSPRSKNIIHQLNNMKDEKKDSPISHNIDKNIVEVPQKRKTTKNELSVEEYSNYESNSINFFYESEYGSFSQLTKKLPISVSKHIDQESLQPTDSQSETLPDLMNSDLEESIISEQQEATWNQPPVRNASNWLLNTEPRDKSRTEKSSFPKSPFDVANHYNRSKINLELYQLSCKTKHTKIEIPESERVSQTGRSSQFQEPETLNCFLKNEKSRFIQKSRTIHQFDDWSSESDGEGDIYYKLSEVEEEKEIKSPGFKTFIEDPTISPNEKNSGI